MKKIVIKSLSILLLTGSIASPVFAQSQPTRYVEAADMLSGTDSTQTACQNKGMGTEDWKQCVVDFAHINFQKWNEHRRVTIKRDGLTFSIELPFNSSWKMGEKPVNLYTVDNLAAAQGRHPNALVFGPIDVGCYGIQDSVCNIDRPYAIILSKKSINSYIAEQKKSIAQYKKEGTFEGETLPFIEFKNGAKRMVMAPTLIENSGGGSMTYGSLLVETRGGFIKLSTTRLTYGDNIDTELWRAAASIK